MNSENENTGVTSAAATSPTGGESAAPDFLSTLPEDIRGEQSLQSFKDTASLAKSYVSAQRMIGSSIRIPTDDASAEAKAEFLAKVSAVPGIVKLPDASDPASVDSFFEKLGRPKTPDEYKLSADHGVPLDPAQIAQFRQLAHKVGLSNGQADALVRFEAARTKTAIESFNASHDKSVETLKAAWGADFDVRLEAAKDLKEHFRAKYPDAVQELSESLLGSNPVVLMMAAELGKLYRETGVIHGDRKLNFGMTPDEARNRINDIKNNPTHAYFNDNDPKHATAVEEVSKLYQLTNPGPQGQ